MRKSNIISLNESNENYDTTSLSNKGTSFKFLGNWTKNIRYLNDEYYIHFVALDGSLWACKKTHISNDSNKPNDNSEFWTKVITGIEGKVYIPKLDDNGELIFSLENTPPEKPIDLTTLKGDKGDPGKSAYLIAKEQGLTNKSESEWIQSLKGKDAIIYKPLKISNNKLYFEASDGNNLTIDCSDLKGDKGDPGLDGKNGITPKIISEVTVHEIEYGNTASANFIPLESTDQLNYKLEINIPQGKPGSKGDKGLKGDKGNPGKDGKPGPKPEFKLVKTNTSLELYWSIENEDQWTKLGEVGGKSPKLIRILGNADSNPDIQDDTRRNDRILWGYDGVPVSEWSTLCYLDDLRGDENIWLGCDEPKMLDGITPDHDKIWYDPCDVSANEWSASEFLYAAYEEIGGTLSKNEFDLIFANLSNFTGSLEFKFVKTFEDLPEPSVNELNKIYLIPNNLESENDLFDEYVCIKIQNSQQYSWEKLGSVSVNSNQFYTKSEIDNKLLNKQNTIISGDNIRIDSTNKIDIYWTEF